MAQYYYSFCFKNGYVESYIYEDRTKCIKDLHNHVQSLGVQNCTNAHLYTLLKSGKVKLTEINYRR